MALKSSGFFSDDFRNRLKCLGIYFNIPLNLIFLNPKDYIIFASLQFQIPLLLIRFVRLDSNVLKIYIKVLTVRVYGLGLLNWKKIFTIQILSLYGNFNLQNSGTYIWKLETATKYHIQEVLQTNRFSKTMYGRSRDYKFWRTGLLISYLKDMDPNSYRK